MTTTKILLLSTAAIVGIGGTSAALTKDQWWPKENNEPKTQDAEERSGQQPDIAQAGKEGTAAQTTNSATTTPLNTNQQPL